MRSLVALLLLSSSLLAADPVPTHKVTLNGQTFTLPVGFTIEAVTTTDQVKRPVAASFDEKGHLYVTEASGTNDPPAKQLVDRPHSVIRLSDTNGDGRFDQSTLFADKLMLPQGIMAFRGSVYVGTPPSIWKLTDTDRDGKADTRTEWFNGKTLTGCANDLHGPYAGPDGWIYWTKGAFARQEYTLPTGKKFSTRASHIFRARPDGTGLEPVMTGGMDNPVDVTFNPFGDRFFTTTFFQHPGNGQRDGVIHAIYGGVYGKDHDPVYEHPWTAPTLMPVMTHLGAAAPCGLHCLVSDRFGAEYRGNLFATCFNMHKVTRHELIPDGATFRTRDHDFVVSDSLDFHPTDVIEDADGSLLVVDTGGWYKLCCPTSQLVKPDVFGAIYRIKKTSSPKLDDPRGLKINWDKLEPKELTRLLGDPRPAVRERAIEQLAQGGAKSIPLLKSTSQSPDTTITGKIMACWALIRIDHPEARAALRGLLDDPDATLRPYALHGVSLWRDREAVPDLIKLLADSDPQTRRRAAEALGRIGDPAAVPALLATNTMADDRISQHALIYALIEIGAADPISKGLNHPHPKIRQAAIVALDQLKSDRLAAAPVLAALDDSTPGLRDAAWWVLGRHSDWASELVPSLQNQLMSIDQTNRDPLVTKLARLSANPDIQKLIAEAAQGKLGSNTISSEAALLAMARSGLSTIPPVWAEALEASLTRPNAALAIQAIRAFPPGKGFPPRLITALRTLGESGGPSTVTLAALAAIPVGTLELSPKSFDYLLGRFSPDNKEKPSFIPEAAEILGKAKLTPEQLTRLASALASAPATERGKLLEAFTRRTDENVGKKLVAVLAEPKLRPSVRLEVVKPILDRYPAGVRLEAASLYKALEEDRSGERKRLEDLFANLPTGDVRRGQVVFNGTKAACITCHQMGYLGGKVGPDLTRIGGIRSERDLLEAIVAPSASFVRSYEPVKVTTVDGRSFQGILKKDAPDEVILAINSTEVVRLARVDIEELVPGTVSVMPAGLDQQLTKQDLADLVAFLRASK